MPLRELTCASTLRGPAEPSWSAQRALPCALRVTAIVWPASVARSVKRSVRPASPRADQVSLRFRPEPLTCAETLTGGSALDEVTDWIAGDPGCGESTHSPAAGFSTRSSVIAPSGR